MKKVYIWGTGKVAEQYLETNEINTQELLGFIESHKTKEVFYGKTVYEPQEINKHSFDYILICVYGASYEIYKIAEHNNLPMEKLIFVDNWEWIDGKSARFDYPFSPCNPVSLYNDLGEIKKSFPKLYQKFMEYNEWIARKYIVVMKNSYDLSHTDSVLETEAFRKRAYWSDYLRYRSFELVVNEIKRNDVEGAVAEVGVFQGEFSKLINEKFSDRKLYLFDTFQSFEKEEFVNELALGYCSDTFWEPFADTSVEEVLNKMNYADKCIVKKGIFPKTVKGLEGEKYAFVSIDVDFEKSTLEALRYFYPRLNRGGYIFLHDYNNYDLDGVKIAVNTYQREIGERLKKVPLADEGGTLVICN